MINVSRQDNDNFKVEVEGQGTAEYFTVTLDDDYHRKLTDTLSKQELIKKSFEFLLEREPLGAIMSSFKLQVISNYFPEYEREIKKQS